VTLGCCVDKDCTDKTCMQLPEGETCGMCVHFARCAALYGADKDHNTCDFFPRLFRRRLSK
jgi:hypothetical protein